MVSLQEPTPVSLAELSTQLHDFLSAGQIQEQQNGTDEDRNGTINNNNNDQDHVVSTSSSVLRESPPGASLNDIKVQQDRKTPRPPPHQGERSPVVQLQDVQALAVAPVEGGVGIETTVRSPPIDIVSLAVQQNDIPKSKSQLEDIAKVRLVVLIRILEGTFAGCWQSAKFDLLPTMHC